MALGDYTKTTWVTGDTITATLLNNNEDKTDELDTELNTHESDYSLQVPYGGTTTNSGNDYSISTPAVSSLTAGMAVAFKCNTDSTGAVTLNWNSQGAVSIKKANGNDVTDLKQNSIYTVRYNGTNFILQGEGATGDATASDLLLGKTATVDAGKITGTMPNNSGDNTALASSNDGTTYKLRAPEGYYDGVDDNVTITDANHIAENIKKDKTVHGVTGTHKRYASGTVMADSDGRFTVSGLDFTPARVVAIAWDGSYTVLGVAGDIAAPGQSNYNQVNWGQHDVAWDYMSLVSGGFTLEEGYFANLNVQYYCYE